MRLAGTPRATRKSRAAAARRAPSARLYSRVPRSSAWPSTVMAQWLARYPNYAVTVEGHADERGTREYNIALGARRATAVVNYLISRGIPQARLSTVSYGKERPVAICNDISCWSQNRRSVTVLTN